ncbi:MAG TPA: hypothetical protein VLJ39_01905 [Tepidisphaeraceae bacterium]|nr:hypothetical protein [Tepidisphaeraceae bacterium]
MTHSTSAVEAITTGLAGAAALTLLHESARHVIPHAPRVDVIGMRGIRRPIVSMGRTPPRGRDLYWMSLLGEVVSNAAFYSLVALGNPKHSVQRGAALGLAAGLGAAFLPPVMGLGNQPHRKAPYTQLMTIAWYTAGGLAAAAMARALGRRTRW